MKEIIGCSFILISFIWVCPCNHTHAQVKILLVIHTPKSWLPMSTNHRQCVFEALPGTCRARKIQKRSQQKAEKGES